MCLQVQLFNNITTQLLHHQLPILQVPIDGNLVEVDAGGGIDIQHGAFACEWGLQNPLPQQVVQRYAAALPAGYFNGECAGSGVGVYLGLKGGCFGNAYARSHFYIYAIRVYSTTRGGGIGGGEVVPSALAWVSYGLGNIGGA